MAKIEKIKLRNFKSFQNAAIPLSSGYTTIVGPNASGKSNLIDSVCFAIGTSSMKNLRADRLTDLVRTDAKDGTAAVEIVVRDGEEKYNIGRSIDKKGNSIFRLNGKRCTRFQIEEALSALNIRPDGHNIIMQGDVNRVIKMTPMQRREIIDEVSGIADYEMKKTESIKELEKVEEKLKEAKIVLSERIGYLNVLQREKLEAENFLRLQDERKKYRASIVKKELAEAERALAENAKRISKRMEKINDVIKEKTQLAQKAEDVEEKYNKLTERIFEKSEKIQSSAREEIEAVHIQLTGVESKINVARKLNEKNSERKQGLGREIADIGNKLAAKGKKTDELFLRIDEIKKVISEKEVELEEIIKTGGRDQIEKKFAEFDKLSEQIEREKEKCHKIDLDIKSITERLNIREAAVLSKDKEMEIFSKKEGEIKNRVAELGKEKKNYSEKLEAAAKALRSAESALRQVRADFEKANEEITGFNERIAAIKSKISVMKNISGRSKAVEAVIKANLEGIVGTVSSLCSYADQHAAAIQSAAGPRFFYVITETAADATSAVKYLKKNKFGRATFIPLDKIQSKKADVGDVLRNKKAVGLAIDLVKFDKKFEKAFQYVFEDTVVVEDIDGAREIGIGKARMVTLDGDLCEMSGAITGGFTKQGVSVAEIRELDSLLEKIKKLAEEKKKLSEGIAKAERELKRSIDEKTEVELKLREINVILQQWDQRIAEYRDTAERSKTDMTGVRSEIVGMKKAVEEKTAVLKELDSATSKLILRRAKLKEILDAPKFREMSEKIRGTQNEIQRLKEEKAEMDVTNRTIKNEMESLLTGRKKLEAEIASLDAENAARADEAEKWSAERNELIKALKEKEEKARKLASGATDLFTEKGALLEERRKLAQEIGELERKIDRWKDEIGEVKIEKAQFDSRCNDLKREMKKYTEVEVLDLDAERLKEMLARTEIKINEMGDVNMKAAEMYDEYKKEVDEIEKKSFKLKEEKEGIMNVIDVIEKKKVHSFMETFAALNEYFDRYFRELYPEEGSSAALRLQDNTDPLNTGLALEANPSGKKIKNIDAMSGGEKSLTALAFLFAIQAYKPSPFYILDEVDAALDAENSMRVARMLKKFSKSLQFLIITHNAPVIRESDQIIGVHMDRGGSSIVEVNLKEYAPVAA